MGNYTVKSIGQICSDDGGFFSQLDKAYIPAMDEGS